MALKVHTDNSDTGESAGSKKCGRSASITDELSLVESDQRLRDFVCSVEHRN